MKDLYKILLVEKNKQMVHVYKNMIPWEEYGFEISSVTDVESDALAYFGEYRYDVIITDTELKAGSGISLIKKLKRIDPKCIVVVISVQSDYDTVRDVFLAGAYDCLLKSRIRYSALATLMEKLKETLDTTHLETGSETKDEACEKLLGLIRDKQKVNLDVLHSLIDTPDFAVLKTNYQLLYFRQDNIKNFNRNMKQYDKPLWMNSDEFVDMFINKISLRDEIQMQLREIIEGCILDIPEAKIIFTKKHSGLLILPKMPKARVEQLAHTIIQTINLRLRYDFSITLSKPAEGIDSFVDTYIETMKYHDHKFYIGDNCVERVSDQEIYNELPQHSLSYNEMIVQGVGEQSFLKVQEGYLEAINYMKTNNVNPSDVKQYFISTMEQIEQMLKKKGVEDEYPFNVLIEGISESESIMFLTLELEKMLKTLIDWNKEHSVSVYHKSVSMMVDYIDAHLNEKITLADVADSAQLSITYASRIFKNDIGESIIEYINKKKMEVAEQLIHDTNKKFKDIALEVGIQDQLYFNKVFKKHYKMSPREYQKKL